LCRIERLGLAQFPAGKYADRGAECFLIPSAGVSEIGEILTGSFVLILNSIPGGNFRSAGRSGL
jgi:hypothetical protein